jgi:hypothetical protein
MADDTIKAPPHISPLHRSAVHHCDPRPHENGLTNPEKY